MTMVVTVREFYLHLSDSKLQNSATTTAHLHKLLAKGFEKRKCYDVEQCGIKQMDFQSSIGVPLPNI